MKVADTKTIHEQLVAARELVDEEIEDIGLAKAIEESKDEPTMKVDEFFSML